MSFSSVRRHAVMSVAGAALATATLVPATVTLAASPAQAVSVKTLVPKTLEKKAKKSSTSAKLIGFRISSKKYGWKTKQWRCLNTLWQRESGWKVTAGNKSSGAYGIPQALPGKKMGKGWKTSATTQITWGLKYIDKRYDTPCAALKHQKKKHWY